MPSMVLQNSFHCANAYHNTWTMILLAVIVMGNIQCCRLEWKMSDFAMSGFHKITYGTSLMPFWQYDYHSIHHDNMVIVLWYAIPVGTGAITKLKMKWWVKSKNYNISWMFSRNVSNDGRYHNCWYLKFHITVSNQIPQGNLTPEGNTKYYCLKNQLRFLIEVLQA